MKFLEDAQGKKSSKRICGAAMLATGFIFSSVLFVFSLYREAADSATALGIINTFLYSGSGVLSVGVLEKVTKVTKVTRRRKDV